MRSQTAIKHLAQPFFSLKFVGSWVTRVVLCGQGRQNRRHAVQVLHENKIFILRFFIFIFDSFDGIFAECIGNYFFGKISKFQ